MMKSCKAVLQCVRELHRRGNWGPSFLEIAQHSGLHPNDVIDACKLLTDEWYLAYLYPAASAAPGAVPPHGVRLTLKGDRPVEYACSQIRDFLKKNWISLLSLAISGAALAVSLSSDPLPDVIRVLVLLLR